MEVRQREGQIAPPRKSNEGGRIRRPPRTPISTLQRRSTSSHLLSSSSLRCNGLAWLPRPPPAVSVRPVAAGTLARQALWTLLSRRGGFLDRSRNGQVRRSLGRQKVPMEMQRCAAGVARSWSCRHQVLCDQLESCLGARGKGPHAPTGHFGPSPDTLADTLRHVKAVSVKGIFGNDAEGFQPLEPLEPNSMPCCVGALHCPAPPARHLSPGRREASRHSKVVLQGLGCAGQGRPCSPGGALNSPSFQVVRRSDGIVRLAEVGPRAAGSCGARPREHPEHPELPELLELPEYREHPEHRELRGVRREQDTRTMGHREHSRTSGTFGNGLHAHLHGCAFEGGC